MNSLLQYAQIFLTLSFLTIFSMIMFLYWLLNERKQSFEQKLYNFICEAFLEKCLLQLSHFMLVMFLQTKYPFAPRAIAKQRGDLIVSVKCFLAQAVQFPDYIIGEE